MSHRLLPHTGHRSDTVCTAIIHCRHRHRDALRQQETINELGIYPILVCDLMLNALRLSVKRRPIQGILIVESFAFECRTYKFIMTLLLQIEFKLLILQKITFVMKIYSSLSRIFRHGIPPHTL